MLPYITYHVILYGWSTININMSFEYLKFIFSNGVLKHQTIPCLNMKLFGEEEKVKVKKVVLDKS